MKKKIIPLLIVLALLAGLLSSGVTSNAGTQTAFYIKHHHIGSSTIMGDCYTVPHYHVHSEPGQGDCYTPRYHEHEGSRTEGGGCYTIIVPHFHTGDPSGPGGCYVPKYHVHTGGCYETRSCFVSRQVFVDYRSTGYCGYHGQVEMCNGRLVSTHHDCGRGPDEEGYDYCPGCGSSGVQGSYNHDYSVLICPKTTSYVEGYVLGCDHEEGDVDHYDPGCGLEGVIEGYDLTCTKTSSTIDYYEPGCGMEEGGNAAAVTVTKTLSNGNRTATLKAQIEDLSGGRIDFSGASFKWTDDSGQEIEGDDSITVSENGNYFIEVVMSHPEIDPDSLKGSLTVDEIGRSGSGGQSGSEGEENGNEGENGTDQGSGNTDDDGYINVTPIPLPSATPTATPKAITGSNEGGRNDHTGEHNSSWNDDTGDEEGDGTYGLSRFTPGGPWEGTDLFGAGDDDIKIEVEAKKADAPNEEEVNAGVVEDNKKSDAKGFLGATSKFLSTPAGKVISIGLSTALLGGLVFILLFFLRNLIIIFNKDGQMKMHLAGITFARLSEDGYVVEIPKDVAQRAYTNRYVLYMGLFLLGRDKDIDVMVVKGDRQTMINPDKLTNVVI
ncbi:MAG: hypothetical protein K6A38_04310 [Lachnospiraceae bacterium]|nr:hypothetical protein [Lachnospiraceae bacterium]